MFDLSRSTIVEWFAWAFFDGIALGVFYDLLRAFKMFCGISYFGEKRKKVLVLRALEHLITFFCDIVFFLVAAVVTLLLIYRMGEGLFRAFTFGGIIAGFMLYHFTLGRLTLRLTDITVRAVKRILKTIARILIFPIKKIFLLIFCLYRLTIGKIVGKIIREVKRKSKRKAVDVPDEKLSSEDGGGEEEYVYVNSKRCYRKSGRISFGRGSGKGTDP